MWYPFRRAATLFVCLLIAFCGLISPHPVQTAQPPQQPATAADQNPTHPPMREYVGEDQCLKCHLSGLPDAQDTAVAALFGSLENDSWVLYEEVKIWAAHDKHAQAYTSLLNERSKKMGELLGVTEIHRDKRCLACHTGLPLDAMQTDPQNQNLIAAHHAADDMRLLRGVGCEGCHGAAGSTSGENPLAGWFTIHTSKQEWRFLDPQVKRDKYGYRNVRSPVVRAQICLACHLGNVEEGKVVTHDMYAAGHPPLPGVELTTFIEQMPRHWRDLADKPAALRDEFLRETNQSPNPSELRRTRELLVGAAVTFAEAMELTADLCDPQVASALSKPAWPDFAQYDCYACHHDLQEPAWRQQRAADAAPGRPRLYAWPTVLVRFGLAFAGSDAQAFENHMQAVSTAAVMQPFGRRDELQRTSRAAAQWAREFAESLRTRQLDRDQAGSVLENLAKTAAGTLHDYDSARQLVWAYEVIQRDLQSPEPGQQPPGPSDERNQALAQLKDMFVLELKSGRTVLQQLPGQPRSREVQEVDLQKTLPPIAGYDPYKFQELFAKLID